MTKSIGYGYIAKPVAFAQLVDTAFNQIRHYGKSDLVITLRLLNAIAYIAQYVHRPQERLALEPQMDMVWQ